MRAFCAVCDMHPHLHLCVPPCVCRSLVGITALTTIKKSCLIFCNTAVSVEQWKQQVEKWTTLPPKHIVTFTAANKDRIQTDALVVRQRRRERGVG